MPPIHPERIRIVEGEEGGRQARQTNAIIVLVDVLRATTTITTALSNGCLKIIPVPTVQEAFHYKTKDPDVLLCGERDGFPPPGFDLGNSPLEYTPARVAGKTLVLTTTNCTRILNAIQTTTGSPSAYSLYAVCLRNLEAVVAHIRAAMMSSHAMLFIVAAGKEEGTSPEDHLAAQLVQSNMLEVSPKKLAKKQILQILIESEHGRDLQEKGLGADLVFCADTNVTTCVPKLYSDAFYNANRPLEYQT